VVDSSKVLWYLMPEKTILTLKKLIKLTDKGINGVIAGLSVDHDSLVHVLCGDSQVLHSLKFNWNAKD
jgi:predicted sulfurtransferase